MIKSKYGGSSTVEAPCWSLRQSQHRCEPLGARARAFDLVVALTTSFVAQILLLGARRINNKKDLHCPIYSRSIADHAAQTANFTQSLLFWVR